MTESVLTILIICVTIIVCFTLVLISYFVDKKRAEFESISYFKIHQDLDVLKKDLEYLKEGTGRQQGKTSWPTSPTA